MQAVGHRESLSRGLIWEINVHPLLASSPIDTVHKNKCTDKRFSEIADSLEHGFVKQQLSFL